MNIKSNYNFWCSLNNRLRSAKYFAQIHFADNDVFCQKDYNTLCKLLELLDWLIFITGNNAQKSKRLLEEAKA